MLNPESLTSNHRSKNKISTKKKEENKIKKSKNKKTIKKSISFMAENLTLLADIYGCLHKFFLSAHGLLLTKASCPKIYAICTVLHRL